MTLQIPARHRYTMLATAGFAASGYDGASLSSLAKVAGVSKQALLHHFGTKQALYESVLTDLKDRLMAKLESTPDVSPKLRLVLHFQSFLEKDDQAELDARLVIRALLDGSTSSAIYPLKPYLDALVSLTRTIDGKKDASDAELLAGLYAIIGSAQYLLIARHTLADVYGVEAQQKIETAARAGFAAQLKSFLEIV